MGWFLKINLNYEILFVFEILKFIKCKSFWKHTILQHILKITRLGAKLIAASIFWYYIGGYFPAIDFLTTMKFIQTEMKLGNFDLQKHERVSSDSCITFEQKLSVWKLPQAHWLNKENLKFPAKLSLTSLLTFVWWLKNLFF